MKKLTARLSTFAGIACLLCATSANAALYQANFSVAAPWTSNIASTAPQQAVSGWVQFTADAPGGDITSITAIDLVIEGHTYTLDEISGAAWGAGSYLFGATVNSLSGVAAGSTDFSAWVFPAYNWAQVSYSVAGASAWWSSNGIGSVNEVAVAEVPEPASLALLLAGGLALVRRRRR